MKRIIPILSVAAILAVVAVVLSKLPPKDPGTTPIPQAGTPSTGNRVVPPAPRAVPVDALAGKLAQRSLLAIDVLPRNVDTMLAPLFDYYQRAAETKLWKRLHPDVMLKAGVEKAVAEIPGLGTLTGLGAVAPSEIPALVKDLWASLTEVAFAVSSATIKVEAPDGKVYNVPPIAVFAKFATAEAAKKYSDRLFQSIRLFKEKAAAEGFVISEPSPGTLEVNATVAGKNETYSALLAFKSQQIVFLAGTKDPQSFIEPEGSAPTSAESMMVRSWLPDTALAGSVRTDALLALAQHSLRTMTPSGGKLQQELGRMIKLLRVYKGIKLTTYSMGVGGGAYRKNTCVELVPGAPLGKTSAGESGKPGSVSVAAQLADAESVFVSDYPISALQRSWKVFQEEQLFPGGPDANEEGAKAFAKVNRVPPKLGFQSASGVIATPPTGSMPRFAVLLTGSALTGDALLDEFVKSGNELVMLARPQHGGTASESVAVKLDRSGPTPVLRIEAGIIRVIGQLAGDNALVFGLDPFLLSKISEKLKGPARLDYLFGRNPRVKDDVTSATYVTLIDVGLALNMLKPWVIGGMSSQVNLTPEELDEIIGLLSASVISTQRVERDGNVLCNLTATYEAGSPGAFAWILFTRWMLSLPPFKP